MGELRENREERILKTTFVLGLGTMSLVAWFIQMDILTSESVTCWPLRVCSKL